jgi:gag-polypeptide of LTR copia-type
MNQVLLCASAQECWNSLLKRYIGKGESQVAHLTSDLYCSTLNDLEPMEPQINRILLAAQSLNSLGHHVMDTTLAYQLVMALPDSMEMLKFILYQIEPSDMNTEHISTRILEDQKRCIRTSGESVSAFFTKSAAKKGRGKGKDKDKDKEKEKSDKKDKKRCTHCRHIGHKKSECQKLKREQ